jgi:hypothetical protein
LTKLRLETRRVKVPPRRRRMLEGFLTLPESMPRRDVRALGDLPLDLEARLEIPPRRTADTPDPSLRPSVDDPDEAGPADTEGPADPSRNRWGAEGMATAAAGAGVAALLACGAAHPEVGDDTEPPVAAVLLDLNGE